LNLPEAAPETPPVCDYEGSDYQSSFWDSGGREYEHRVEGIALRRLLPKSGGMLLELGAGAGRNTPRYSGFEQVALLDYSYSQLSQAQARLGKSSRYLYVAADIYRLPFIPGVFDAATMIRTLHHMAEPRLAIRQVRQALRPGATFVLEYANKQNLKAILRYWLRQQTWSPFSLEPVEFARLNFDFHPRAVRGWLEESGFMIQRQLSVSHFRMGLLKRLIPLDVLVSLDSLAQWTGRWWLLTPSVFVRTEATGAPEAGEARLEAGSGIFCCPECGQFPLTESEQALECPACGRAWRIQDGIYDFRKPIGQPVDAG